MDGIINFWHCFPCNLVNVCFSAEKHITKTGGRPITGAHGGKIWVESENKGKGTHGLLHAAGGGVHETCEPDPGT